MSDRQWAGDCADMLESLEAGHGGSIRDHASRLGWTDARAGAALEQLKRDGIGLRHSAVLGVWWLPSYERRVSKEA